MGHRSREAILGQQDLFIRPMGALIITVWDSKDATYGHRMNMLPQGPRMAAAGLVLLRLNLLQDCCCHVCTATTALCTNLLHKKCSHAPCTLLRPEHKEHMQTGPG